MDTASPRLHGNHERKQAFSTSYQKNEQDKNREKGKRETQKGYRLRMDEGAGKQSWQMEEKRYTTRVRGRPRDDRVDKRSRTLTAHYAARLSRMLPGFVR